jgi:L-lactate dehydrogenase complex protein LldG
MTDDRRQVLESVRRALRRPEPERAVRAAIERRIADAAAGPLPARGQIEPRARLDLFVAMAEEASATVARVSGRAAVPAAVADYLARENLPAAVRVAPDPAVADLPWHTRPLIEVTAGPTRGGDPVSLTPALAGVAETGTLALISGPTTPTTLNLLADVHIVLLEAGRVVGGYEDVWRLLREVQGKERMPRTVNFITGPSRSADIEQTLQMGAHGPRRLHIILLDGEAQP